MSRQGFIHIGLTLALLVAAIMPPPSALALPADVNGDRMVDVLDLQIAVASLLSAQGDVSISDVNGDGAVDILDVQRILSQAGETSAPEPDSEDPGVPEGISTPSSPSPHAAGLLQLDETLSNFQEPASASPLPADRAVHPPPSEFRLVRGLSPHAPPASAWSNV